MELVVSIFLGAWISFAGVLAYRQVKKEYERTEHSEVKANKSDKAEGEHE